MFKVDASYTSTSRNICYREQQIDSIFLTPFRSRNIVAERKMGKTSFLGLLLAPDVYVASVKRLQAEYPDFCPITTSEGGGYRRVLPVRVDMVKCRTLTLFFCQLIESLLNELGNEVTESLSTALDLPVLSVSAITTRLIQLDDPRLIYMLTDQLLRKIKRDLRIYPMILIDRFDALLDAPEFRTPDFFEYLAGWEEEFTLIIASIESVLNIRETVRSNSDYPWRASSNLGKSFGSEIHLPPFSHEQCTSYISATFGDFIDQELSSSDYSWIIKCSGGIPYFAIRLVTLYLSARSEIKAIRAARELAQMRFLQEEGDRLFAGYWTRLRCQLHVIDPMLEVSLRYSGWMSAERQINALISIEKRTSLLRRQGRKIVLFSPLFHKFISSSEPEHNLSRVADAVIGYFNGCATHRSQHHGVWCGLDPELAKKKLVSVRENIELIEHGLEQFDQSSLLLSKISIEDLSLIRAILEKYFEATEGTFVDALRKEFSQTFTEWPSQLTTPCYFLKLYADSVSCRPEADYDDQKRQSLTKDLLR